MFKELCIFVVDVLIIKFDELVLLFEFYKIVIKYYIVVNCNVFWSISLKGDNLIILCVYC